MFTHQSSILEDSAGHGHWYFGRGAKQATGYGNGTAGQFRSGLGQHIAGGRITRIGSCKHRRKQSSKVGRWSGVRRDDQFVQTFELPRFQNRIEQR